MFIKKIAIAATLALAANMAPVHAETTLLFNVFVPRSNNFHKVAEQWANDVKTATNGEVIINFTAGNMAPPPEQLEAVKSGVFDIAFIANIFLKNKAPLLQATMLPWLVNKSENASVALWNIYKQHIEPKAPFPDAHLLTLFHWEGGHVASITDTAINSIDELKSRKMWALPGPPADTLKTLGMSPVATPAIQVGEMVSRKIVSGYTGIAPEIARDFKAGSYTKSITRFPRSITSTSFSVFINKDKWNALSQKNKDAISSVSGEHFAAMAGAASNREMQAALDEMTKHGVKVVQADPKFYEALQAAATPQFDAMREEGKRLGVDIDAMLADFIQKSDALN
ncbi:TRAP transporter substrate-binding protein DctP [Pusillimonas sp. T2]|uniref:TRAP transporter substrate-binding protein DctP n=1 Tax=Pusillimonas sp. T2 TaxID=1548123 RepID=UPI0013036135|nr:TRAP transporter substrate-binding protein DctP [Pusillimonas sp. T2]